ncbi:MAG: hypothetical protein RLZ35_442 [Pseudomonadota bacterium]|jgi:hypothetical protein
MTAQVIFLNTNYFPPPEELSRLQKLQDKLTGSRIELLLATRNYSPGERYLAFQRYHNGFKYRWLIYYGFKKDPVYNSTNPI